MTTTTRDEAYLSRFGREDARKDERDVSSLLRPKLAPRNRRLLFMARLKKRVLRAVFTFLFK